MRSDAASSFSDEDIETLAALVRSIAEVDGFVTEDESDAMEAIAEWAGPERFWAAFGKSRDDGHDVSDLEALAAKIDDEEVRKSSYAMLRLLAASDGTAGTESAALERLRAAWSLPEHR